MSGFVQPERAEQWAQHDAQRKHWGGAFFVYVLDTNNGYYVGHSHNPRKRLKEHQAGECYSTAGLDPQILWVSAPLNTREEACSFEAAMKAMMDKGDPRFYEIIADRRPAPIAADDEEDKPMGSLLFWFLLAISVYMMVAVLWPAQDSAPTPQSAPAQEQPAPAQSPAPTPLDVAIIHRKKLQDEWRRGHNIHHIAKRWKITPAQARTIIRGGTPR